jgi:cytochrome oxidase Cu insertion factor (SCO1/SenC/PrrC family)
MAVSPGYRRQRSSRVSIQRPARSWAVLTAVVMLAAILVGCGLLGGAEGAPQEGDVAPDFTLAAADGEEVSLSNIMQEHETVVLVFYRGFF